MCLCRIRPSTVGPLVGERRGKAVAILFQIVAAQDCASLRRRSPNLVSRMELG